MKSVLVIGMGRFGRHAAHKLYDLGHDVMAVDIKESSINDVISYVTYAQIGDSTDSRFLGKLGVRDFDMCIVAIGDDFQSSLETTSLLKELGARFVVARACRDVHAKFLKRNGADEVVYPEAQLGEWIALRFGTEHILNFFEIDQDTALFEVQVPKAWVGKTLGQLDVRKKYSVNIVGIKGNGKTNIMLTPDTIFTSDTSLLVAGAYKDVQKMFSRR